MFDAYLGSISRALTILAGFFVVAMMVHICADIGLRLAVGRSLQGTVEIVSAYYMVGVIFLPLTQVTRDREHIAADLMTRRLSQGTQYLVHMVVSVVGVIFMTWFSYQSVLSAIHKTQRAETWEAGDSTITVWPSRWILAISLCLMTLQLLVHLVTELRRGRAGDDDGPSTSPAEV